MSNEKKKRKQPNHDSFLSSMTFAGGFVRNCDCDECDLVPKPIADAIRQHKRMIAKTSTLTRTQDRTLVARLGLISVWKLTMPLDAEPLVEFGNSHRIVLIDALSSKSRIVSIGKGVVGSADETTSRTKLLDWSQSSAWLVPQNGGKALGWVHMKDDNATNEEPIGHAVIYSIKIPVDVLETTKEENGDSPGWMRDVASICKKSLPKPNDDDNTKHDYAIKLSTEDADLLNDIIRKLIS